jgi:hypothetical protein
VGGEAVEEEKKKYRITRPERRSMSRREGREIVFSAMAGCGGGGQEEYVGGA